MDTVLEGGHDGEWDTPTLYSQVGSKEPLITVRFCLLDFMTLSLINFNMDNNYLYYVFFNMNNIFIIFLAQFWIQDL